MAISIDPTIVDAIEEAYASAPADVVVLEALEIHHRTFLSPVRIVRWPVLGPQPEIFLLKLEASAPANPGEIVEFIGAPFSMTYPEKSADGAGSITIRIDGVDDVLDDYLKNAAIGGGAITAVYREFIKDLTGQGPGSVWYGLEMHSPRMEGMTFVIEGAVLNWTMRSYGTIYTAMGYPGLVIGR